MSAFGFLVAAPAFELVQAYFAPLEAADLASISSLLQRMEDKGPRIAARRRCRSAWRYGQQRSRNPLSRTKV